MAVSERWRQTCPASRRPSSPHDGGHLLFSLRGNGGDRTVLGFLGTHGRVFQARAHVREATGYGQRRAQTLGLFDTTQAARADALDTIPWLPKQL